MKFYNPVEYVLFKFDGVRATARALGLNASSISRWQHKRAKSGTAQIPLSSQILILKVAREREIDILPEDLIIGRTVE